MIITNYLQSFETIKSIVKSQVEEASKKGASLYKMFQDKALPKIFVGIDEMKKHKFAALASISTVIAAYYLLGRGSYTPSLPILPENMCPANPSFAESIFGPEGQFFKNIENLNQIANEKVVVPSFNLDIPSFNSAWANQANATLETPITDENFYSRESSSNLGLIELTEEEKKELVLGGSSFATFLAILAKRMPANANPYAMGLTLLTSIFYAYMQNMQSRFGG